MLNLLTFALLYLSDDPLWLEIWHAAKRKAIEQGRWCPGRAR